MKIAQFGLGTVGLGTYELIEKLKQFQDIEYTKIGVINPNKTRTVPERLLSFYPGEILSKSNHEVLIEAIDNADSAFQYVSDSLKKGIPVISASKKMIAENLPELISITKKTGTPFYYEAAVCGSIPIIKILNEYYPKGSITKIRGILNGTCNYILSKIELEDLHYQEALKQAQDAGFAETNPLTDVGGYDSGNKLSILIYQAFGIYLHPKKISINGITFLNKKDIQDAKRNGKRYKLIAEAYLKNGEIYASVQPTLVDINSEAAQISNEYNWIEISSDLFGIQTFSGKGAGAYPTAIAVLGDLQSLIKERKKNLELIHQG